jgi:aryl sulfotransferase
MTRHYRTVLTDSARWEGFEFRDGDVIISTPAKCGTTWMQMICALLIFQDSVLPGRLTELSPWVDVQTEAADHVLATLAAQTHRRFIKSHTPFDGLPFDERATYICVGRDPRDVAVSWDHHFANMNLAVIIGARVEAVGADDIADLMPKLPPPPPADPVERFWQWVDDDRPVEQNLTGLRGTMHHLDTFWQHRNDPNVLLFHYADMKADLDGQMRRLSAALGIEVDEQRWPGLVTAAGFERMRERAEQLAPQVKIDGFWNDTSQFFHQGSSGQWQSFLGPEDQARYEARLHELASSELAQWVHTGWLGS